VLALVNQQLPPTMNLDNVDPSAAWTTWPTRPSRTASMWDVHSFGFGGINATADHAALDGVNQTISF